MGEFYYEKTKSILSIFLAFAVIFGFSSSALASSNYEVYNMVHEECKNSKSEIEQHLQMLEASGGNVFSVTINEFDYYLGKMQEENSILLYSNEDTLNYRNILEQKVLYANTLSDEQLKAVGYTEEQMVAIRNYDGSDALLKAASTALTIFAGFDPIKTSSSGSTTKLVATFDWHGLYSPGGLLSYEDILGVPWDSPWYADEDNAIVSFRYYNEYYNDSVWVDGGELVPTGSYCEGIIIPNNESTTINGTVVGHWITGGGVQIPLSTRTQQVEITGFVAYGKNTISVTPSISFSVGSGGISGGGGFSFSKGVDLLAPTRIHWPTD